MPELPPPPPPPMSVAAAVADVVKARLPAWVSPRSAVVACGAFAAALAVLASLGWGPARAAAPVVELPKVGSAGDPSGSTAGGPQDAADGGDAAGEPATVAVHAAGAFARPGLYELPAGARVADLVDAAGGPAPGAVVDALNLAAKLSDGERIYLPKEGEVAPAGGGDPAGSTSGSGAASGGSGVVDLNSATLDQLDSLPGVGPSTAQAILDYRKEHGRFRAVDELLEVRGIGEAKLAAIRKRVKV